jgi:SAM-dependent methyltransferase
VSETIMPEMTLDSTGHSHCPACEFATVRQITERFDRGVFLACRHCGLHFAEAAAHDLPSYYARLWSGVDTQIEQYKMKIHATTDQGRLQRLLVELPRYRWAVRQLKHLPRGARVLDVGCGEGTLLWAAHRMGLEPHGCDIAQEAVQLVRELLSTENVHQGTLGELSYEPDSFDVIIALEVLEHLEKPRPFLRRAEELLQPGGLLLLTTPNRQRFFARVKRFLGMPHSNTDYPPHHFTRWSAQSLTKLLRAYFSVIRIGSLPYYFEHPIGRKLAFPLHLLTAMRMGQSLWAFARKCGDRREG